MRPESQVARELSQLAGQVLDVVRTNSAGEMSRRHNWGLFVKAIPHNYTLKELADECFDALSEDQNVSSKDVLTGCIESESRNHE